MTEEKISHKLRLENMDETINYLIEVINQNKLINKKHSRFLQL